MPSEPSAPTPDPTTPDPPTPDPPTPASGRRRAAARLIDAAVGLLASAAPQLVLVAAVVGLDVSFEAMTAAAAAALVLMAAIHVLLRVGLPVRWGCTVGQRVAGVRVVMADDPLRRPGWKAAFRRYRPTWGSHVSPGTGPWSDLLAYRRDERTRRCLHDRTAGTMVIAAAVEERAVRAALAAAIPVAALAIVLGVLLLV